MSVSLLSSFHEQGTQLQVNTPSDPSSSQPATQAEPAEFPGPGVSGCGAFACTSDWDSTARHLQREVSHGGIDVPSRGGEVEGHKVEPRLSLRHDALTGRDRTKSDQIMADERCNIMQALQQSHGNIPSQVSCKYSITRITGIMQVFSTSPEQGPNHGKAIGSTVVPH